MRGIPDGTEFAAPVNETECSMKVIPYPHPTISHFVIWDLPGAGTENHPIVSYFEDKCLLAYDAVILNCG